MTQKSIKNPVVQVSGRGTNVEFVIDDVSPFDQVTKGLHDYLVENRELWSGGAIAVNVGNRLTSRDQLIELKKIIETGSGLNVTRFSCSPEAMAPPANAPDAETVRPMQHNEVIIPDRKPNVVSQPPVRPVAAPVASSEKPRQAVLPIVETSQVAQPPKTHPQHNEVITPERNPAVEPPLPSSPAAAPVASNKQPRQAVLPIIDASQVVPPTKTYPQHNVMTPEPPIAQPEPQAVVDAEPLLTDDERAKSKRPSYLQSRRDTALLVKSTCRSGEIIRHQGDVVVLGDVNPGAEVVATGDIVVFGCLRGFAHAGSEGDAKATIVALSLGSPRVQIGPYVGMSTGNGFQSRYTDSGPVIAYARRRSIHVALFEGRFFKYGKGELYDG